MKFIKQLLLIAALGFVASNAHAMQTTKTTVKTETSHSSKKEQLLKTLEQNNINTGDLKLILEDPNVVAKLEDIATKYYRQIAKINVECDQAKAQAKADFCKEIAQLIFTEKKKVKQRSCLSKCGSCCKTTLWYTFLIGGTTAATLYVALNHPETIKDYGMQVYNATMANATTTTAATVANNTTSWFNFWQ